MKHMIFTCISVFVVSPMLFLGTAYGEGQGLGPEYQMDEQTTNSALSKRGFSPYAGRTYPTQMYWGDQHVHTGWSVDAGGFGATLGPEESLRFARGEEVTLVHARGVESPAAKIDLDRNAD